MANKGTGIGAIVVVGLAAWYFLTRKPTKVEAAPPVTAVPVTTVATGTILAPGDSAIVNGQLITVPAGAGLVTVGAGGQLIPVVGGERQLYPQPVEGDYTPASSFLPDWRTWILPGHENALTNINVTGQGTETVYSALYKLMVSGISGFSAAISGELAVSWPWNTTLTSHLSQEGSWFLGYTVSRRRGYTGSFETWLHAYLTPAAPSIEY